MRRIINSMLWIILFTFLILCSYGRTQNQLNNFSPGEIYRFLTDFSIKESLEKNVQKKSKGDDSDIDRKERSIWVSYLEWNAYSRSVKKNTEKEFRKFFGQILSRLEECHITNLIVQVRPFSDALYSSSYFPWAACISGEQGKSPGFDPLEIMVEMTHNKNMTIEAWINPYRISSGDKINTLAKNNPARKWYANEDTKRNVLYYEGAYYYNPASEEVQMLIINGVREIVDQYNVDGIHMDDYFYPVFRENNAMTAFDAREYKEGKMDGSISEGITMAKWRRENVNHLVQGIYKAIKKEHPDIRFGISPQGNIHNLKSEYGYYVDIDRWVKESGYIDYIMPQIYWGFEHEEAPFEKMLKEWIALTDGRNVDLKIGLQLYRMGSSEKNLSDYEELQNSALIKQQLDVIGQNNSISGYCFFSYQYLDADNNTYPFDSHEFSTERKQILNEVALILKNES